MKKNNIDYSKYTHIRTKDNTIVNKKDYTGFHIFNIIFLVILVMCVIRFTFTGTTITFTGFLEFLQSCPSIDMPSSVINSLNIPNSWGMFDFIRTFINSLGTITGTILWLITNLLNGLMFIFYFIGFIFGV